MADEEINKLPKTMPCPYHGCLPVYRKDVFVQAIGNWPEMCNHYWYCPKCKEENPTPNRWNAFGCGYCSQYSAAAARANWNNAVHRRQLSILKKAIKTGN